MRYLLFLIPILVISACDSKTNSLNNSHVVNTIPASNNIRQYLTSVANRITKNSLKEIKNAEQWEHIKPRKYQQFIEMMSLGDMPLTYAAYRRKTAIECKNYRYYSNGWIQN